MGRRGAGHVFFVAKNINSARADSELSDTVGVMQSSLVADREKAQLLH